MAVGKKKETKAVDHEIEVLRAVEFRRRTNTTTLDLMLRSTESQSMDVFSSREKRTEKNILSLLSRSARAKMTSITILYT